MPKKKNAVVKSGKSGVVKRTTTATPAKAKPTLADHIKHLFGEYHHEAVLGAAGWYSELDEMIEQTVEEFGGEEFMAALIDEVEEQDKIHRPTSLTTKDIIAGVPRKKTAKK